MGNSRIIKKRVIYYLFLIVFSLNAQTRSVNQSIKDYQLSSEQYISGADGKVYMNVSFWGEAGNTGTIRVYEGIDFASLISAVGGPSEYANLKKIRLYREKPDQNGQLIYFIDLTKFLDTGDRSNFPRIKPNDTIVINKTFAGTLIEDISTIQTLIGALTLFITLVNTFNLQ